MSTPRRCASGPQGSGPREGPDDALCPSDASKQAEDPAHLVSPWTVSDQIWNISCWVLDVDALHAELAQRGAGIAYGLCDQPYGCREFGVQNLDGRDIRFGQPTG